MTRDRKKHTNKGFTLIELVVAVALFGFIAVAMIGAMLAVVDGNKKTRTTIQAIDNLNFALESMTREIRVGNSYDCSGIIKAGRSDTGDCATGTTTLGILSSDNDLLVYRHNPVDLSIERCGSLGTDCPNPGNPANYVRMTGANVAINDLMFYTQGSSNADNEQPRVTVLIEGTAGNSQVASSFNLQTTITQRFPDF